MNINKFYIITICTFLSGKSEKHFVSAVSSTIAMNVNDEKIANEANNEVVLDTMSWLANNV